MPGLLLLFSGGGGAQTILAPLAGDTAVAYGPGLVFGQTLSAPLAGVSSEAFPPALDGGAISLSAPLAGSASEAFAAGFVFAQTVLAPLAGTDAQVFAAALSSGSTLLAPLAGTDAEAFAPSVLWDQTLLAPLAGSASEAFPGSLNRDQFLLAACAEAGAWVFPALVQSDEDIAAALQDGLTVKVFSRANALLATLDDGTAKAYTDQVDDTGVGTVTVQNDDADYAHTGFDRMLRFYLGGQPRFTSLVEARDVTSLDPNGGANEITRLYGRGSLALLEEGVVAPSRGVGSLPIEVVRSFSWVSPDFTPVWPAAKQMARQDQWTPTWRAAVPRAWPDPTAYFIGPDLDSASSMLAPDGTCLYWSSFTLAAETVVRIFAAFDNSGQLYLDGAQIFDLDSFIDGQYVQVTLSAGTHYLAARVTNYVQAILNPIGLICTVFSVDPTGMLDTLLHHTDSTWKCLPYPTTEPGFTVGHVLRILLEEAQARDECTDFVLGFTDTLDSNGNPWPIETEITVNVGRSLLEVAQEMAGSTADIAVAPGALVLRAWRYGERGVTRPLTLTAGSDLIGLTHSGKRTSVNAVQALWAGGWLEELDAASIAANGRRTTFLDLSAVQSEEKARQLCRETMAIRSSPRYAVTADVDPATALEAQALHALEAGDTITHPNEALAPEAGRIRALTVEEVVSGRIDRKVRLNDIAEETETRHDVWLRRMAPGALAGGSRIVAPGGQPPISARSISTVQVAEFSYEGDVATSSVVRLLLNGAYLGESVTFTTPTISWFSADEQKVPLSAQVVHANVDHLQIEVDGVLSQRRPAAVSGNLIDFMVTRTAAADGTAGLDAQARAI